MSALHVVTSHFYYDSYRTGRRWRIVYRAGLSNGQTGQLPRAPRFGGPVLFSTINY